MQGIIFTSPECSTYRRVEINSDQNVEHVSKDKTFKATRIVNEVLQSTSQYVTIRPPNPSPAPKLTPPSAPKKIKLESKL